MIGEKPGPTPSENAADSVAVVSHEREPEFQTPFSILRGRRILGAFFVGILASIIIEEICPSLLWKNSEPLPSALNTLLLDCCILLMLGTVALRAGIRSETLFGPFPPWKVVQWSVLIGCIDILVSLAASQLTYILVHLPLSYPFPNFIDLLTELEITRFWATGDYVIPANLLSFFSVGLFTPVFEEFFFRGLLLTRWSYKWGVPKAIFVSSTFFAIGHVNVIGAFFFSYMVSVLYIRTRSLYVPIVVHATVNCVACAGMFMDTLASVPIGGNTLSPSEWVLLVAGGVTAAPWIFRFIKHNIPGSDWKVPYFSSDTMIYREVEAS